MKQRGEWWIGWIQEVPGVNAQERTKAELLQSLREVLVEALEFNREEARKAAEGEYLEEQVMICSAASCCAIYSNTAACSFGRAAIIVVGKSRRNEVMSKRVALFCTAFSAP